jgi:enoyl-CoA hydratase/carnithine racemase
LREEWFNISFTIKDYVGRIAFSEPMGNNFISVKLLREFKNALKICHHSNEIKVIVISGSNGCFSKGVDKEELSTYDAAELCEFSEFGWKVFNKLSEIKKPVIAEVNGDAFGAGFELVLLSDLAFSASDANFGFPGISDGITPSFGGISNLIDMVGFRATKNLIFRNKIISSKEALDLGIINNTFPKEELSEKVNSVCNEIINNNLSAIGDIKESIGQMLDITRRLRLNSEKNIFSLYGKK